MSKYKVNIGGFVSTFRERTFTVCVAEGRWIGLMKIFKQLLYFFLYNIKLMLFNIIVVSECVFGMVGSINYLTKYHDFDIIGFILFPSLLILLIIYDILELRGYEWVVRRYKNE